MGKMIRENPDIAAAHKTMMDYLETKDNQASMYATLLVIAKTFGEFILKHNNLIDLPREIQYFLAMTWNNYAAIYLPQQMLDIQLDADFQDYFESGHLDDRFAMVVKQLHEICKKEKLL